MKELADAPFALIGVNSDKDREKIRKIVREKDINWRSFWNGPEGGGGPISTTWNVRGWPTIVLIDHDGIIRARDHSLDDELLHRLVDEARRATKKAVIR